jgi:hypothetical protein
LQGDVCCENLRDVLKASGAVDFVECQTRGLAAVVSVLVDSWCRVDQTQGARFVRGVEPPFAFLQFVG